MFGDDLNVRVTSSTTDFQAGMEAAERGLSEVRGDAIKTAGALQVLQGRMDETGDEAQTAGAKAGASSGGFLSAAAGAATAEISFSSLSVITVATLIPALLALSTVIAPLTAALGGFIAVAGAIGGIGLIGFLGGAATNAERLKATFQDLTATIRNEFAPVFDIFANVLDNLMRSLTEIIPELVPAEKVIRKIAGQFEKLGEAVIDVLPAFVDLAVELTNRFLPAFVEWATGVLPKVPGFLRSLIPTMREVGATLSPLVDSFLRIAPAMTDFGMTVLNIVTPALTKAVDLFGRAMQAVNDMDAGMGSLTTKMIIIAPLIATVGSALIGLSGGALAVVAAVGALGAAFATNFGGIRDTVMGATRAVRKFVSSLKLGGIVRAIGLVENLRGAFDQLMGIASTFRSGLVPAIQTFATTLRENRPAIRQFFQVLIENVNGAVTVLRNVFLPALRFVVENFAIPLVQRLAQVFRRNFGDILREVTQTMQMMQNRFQQFAAFVRPLWNRWGDEIVTVAKYAFDAVITSVELFLSTLKNMFMVAMNLVQGDWRAAWESFKQIFKDALRIVGDFVSRWDLPGKLRSVAKSAVESFKSAFDLKGAVDSAITAAQNRIDSWTPDWPDLSPPSVPGGGGGGSGGDGGGGGGVNIPGLDTGGFIESDGIYMGHAGERVLNPAETERLQELGNTDTGGTGSGVQQIKLVLEERTDIVQGRIQEGAQMVVEERERAVQRNTGRNPSPR